ncbi:MAG TPA: autotransporter outer membrane beta-barrel domain-containing protein, partial [Kiloniellales bacterium]|nr:autotransporter outer membrane beta-barrel domain-containing protein [Kiloniellales bacterium]
DGRSDHVEVRGKATLDPGAVLVVEHSPGEYPLNTDYGILSSSEAIEGTFSPVESDRPFLDFRVTSEDDRRLLNLHLGRSDTSFESLGRTRNQRSVARALGTLDAGEEGSLYRQLVWMTEEEALEAYDSLSGEVHATGHSMPADIGRRLRGQLMKRMSGLTGSSSTRGGELQANSLASLAVADADPAPAPATADSGAGPAAWMEVFAGTGTLDGDGNAAEARTSSWGGLIGAEMLFSEHFGMGLALGYQDDRVKLDGRSSRLEVDTYSLSTYGMWRSGAWSLRGGAGFAWHDFESERTISLPSGNRRAEADYDGWSAQVFGEVGHRFDLEDLVVEPFAGLAFHHSRTESYRESGAGDANLEVGKDRHSALYSTIGVQVSETFELDDGLRLRPFATLGWEHRLTGSSGDADLAFAAGGSRFTVSGPKRSKDAALVGVGLDIGLGSGVEAFGAYDGYLSRRQHDHTARAGLRVRF